MLEKLISATARPLHAATGATAVIVSLFGVLTAFNVGLTPEQQSALVVFAAVLGQWVVAITGSTTLSRIIGDPTIPSIEPGDPVPVRALPSPLTTAPAPAPEPAAGPHLESGGKHSTEPWT
jgi:hypothetical protein